MFSPVINDPNTQAARGQHRTGDVEMAFIGECMGSHSQMEAWRDVDFLKGPTA